MKTYRVARAWVWVPVVGSLLLVPACGGSAEKASGDTAAVPETAEGYRTHAAQLRREGKHKEAVDAAVKAFTLAGSGNPRVPERLELAKAFGAGGQAASAINEIKELEKAKRDSGLPVDEVEIAEVYAQIGDPNAVFRWLDRAVAARSPKLAGIAENPDLEPVKTDPRWQGIVAAAR
jgi:hypothetical protein